MRCFFVQNNLFEKKQMFAMPVIFVMLLMAIAGVIGYIVGKNPGYLRQHKGEALVSDAIQQAFHPRDWHLLNNVTLPISGGTTQIDHILISRHGVFVIETKHYSGWIFGKAHDKQWRQVLYKKAFFFQNPIHQNYKHILAVRELLDFLPKNQIIGHVVFSGTAEFRNGKPPGVFTLPEFIKHLKSEYAPEILSVNQQHLCIGRLECERLSLTKETDVRHREHLDKRYGRSG